jgi:superfamily II DNA or RNA helicase
MSQSLSEVAIGLGYASGDDDLVRDFYVPCLAAASTYSRAVGYFRSTLYVLVGVAFSDFAKRGGKIRLICSPHLSPEDIKALDSAYDEREVVGKRTLEEVRELVADVQARPVTEFLATLVAAGVLDIRIAYKPSKSGIFHQKLGIFEDTTGGRVSFNGSANETYSAWDVESNSESFDVFRSWQGGSEAERVTRHVAYFERLWAGKVCGLKVADFPELARSELVAARLPQGIDDAADRVRHLVGTKEPTPPAGSGTPPPSGRRTLQKHQSEVLANWRAAGFRGVVPHVTGAGKTVTALQAVREWCEGGRPAVILVPSELLAKQWFAEVAKELGDLSPTVVVAGAGNTRASWEALLADLTRGMPELGARITIATLQTASRGHFRSRVQGGEHLLVVADEVHRLGSAGCADILSLQAGGRLGLSATPERFGDPAGTARILGYFGARLPPPFGIPEAIAARRLVPYDYHVHQVRLTGTEQEGWNKLTETIRREYSRLPKAGSGTRIANDRFRLLLFRRAAILKQAQGKADLAIDLLQREYREGDRWLVYCDAQGQLGDVLAGLQRAKLPAYEYHSAMEGERGATMSHFSARGGILVAIRCLDEGVDIPSVNRALILASSTNSREFIQRRGRVLRAHADKFSAEVHDCLVLPAVSVDESGDETAILRSELRRSAEFAQYARNKAVGLELAVLARRHGIDDFDLVTGEQEEHDDGGT